MHPQEPPRLSIDRNQTLDKADSTETDGQENGQQEKRATSDGVHSIRNHAEETTKNSGDGSDKGGHSNCTTRSHRKPFRDENPKEKKKILLMAKSQK